MPPRPGTDGCGHLDQLDDGVAAPVAEEGPLASLAHGVVLHNAKLQAEDLGIELHGLIQVGRHHRRVVERYGQGGSSVRPVVLRLGV